MTDFAAKAIFEVRWVGQGQVFDLPWPWRREYVDNDGFHSVALVRASNQNEAWDIIKTEGFKETRPKAELTHVIRHTSNYDLEEFKRPEWTPEWPPYDGDNEVDRKGIREIAERVSESLYFVRGDTPVPDERVVFEDITAKELRRMVDFVRSFAKA